MLFRFLGQTKPEAMKAAPFSHPVHIKYDKLCTRTGVQEGVSQVNGKGVFARVDLQPGSTIGIYPGRPRSAADMAAKAKQVSTAQP